MLENGKLNYKHKAKAYYEHTLDSMGLLLHFMNVSRLKT